MSENIILTEKTKQGKYQEILPQIYSLISHESNLVANCANTVAVLKEVFNFFWVGFYFTDKETELVLGPFQGPLACTRIKIGKGVCGKVLELSEAILVDDVELFPGHIACSSLSKSEIVIPIIVNNKVVAVLDIDSDKSSYFDDIDMKYLTEMCNALSKTIFK